MAEHLIFCRLRLRLSLGFLSLYDRVRFLLFSIFFIIAQFRLLLGEWFKLDNLRTIVHGRRLLYRHHLVRFRFGQLRLSF